ncbi:hypothetical protein RclHR1_13770005 [Rhizophagus clarus]|uniref:2'-5' RNA ligase n=1 Tax=Rhizophagus clarus TaxID=94130 RepID=A0A2Z6QAX8_9GLOM|nr:hypothetical protein RclHR1_13770005 [Rhizophagus clarus]GET04947.1 2'-5' RNA ligase [Rhizophagus clarus]
MKTLFDNCNVPFVKELSRGSFLSCINYDPNFNTLIPQDFSLALIQSNKAEGIVIRPLNLDSKKFGHVMLKIKSEDFEERLRRKPKLGDFSSLSMSIQPDLFLNFINKNRLESVISKEGSLGRENEDRFLRLLVEDALKDIKECSDIGKKYLSMSKSNKEKVHHLLFAEGKKVIQKYIEDDLVNL